MILNETPLRTAKNFGINNIKIEDLIMPSKIEKFEGLTITGDIEEIKIWDQTKKEKLKYGINKELEKQSKTKTNQDIQIIIDSSKEKNISLEFKFDEKNINLVDNIEIIANENAKANIILKYTSSDMSKGYHNGILKVSVKKNSKIDMTIVNFLNKVTTNFLCIENELQENAELNYNMIDFGGKYSISNYYSNLIGNNSKNNLNTIYLGNENQVFDINYIAELRGEKSIANIDVQGALDDEAKKNFKGTIDFKKGAKKAIGNEEEFCILLSENARSKALPMLLCTEEDVEGSHSSAAGKVDEKQLFYIMSRGFSYLDALKLIVKARFNKVTENIIDVNLRNEILEKI